MEKAPPEPGDGNQRKLTAQLQVRSRSQKELYEALETGDVGRVEHVLQGNEHLSNLKSESQQTPLRTALSKGHSTIVQMLLTRFQADPNETDEFGNTPLHTVCEKGNYEALKTFLKCVQVPDTNAQNKVGDTPLMKSSQRGFSVIVEHLLQHNADPNIPNHSGRTPLMAAAAKGHKDVVQTLLKHGADVLAIMDEEYSGMPTALFEATKSGSAPVTSLILQGLNDAVEKNREIFTCKIPNRVTQLMKSGVKLDQRRGDGCTPLMVHAESGNEAVVQVLIQHKASLNSQDKAGKTALMMSSYQGHILVVQILVQHAALLNIQCKAGRTALIYATMGKHLQVVKHLCISGADTGISDENGKTAKEVAAELQFSEIEQYLSSKVNVDLGSHRDPFVLKVEQYLKEEREKRSETHEKGSTSTHDQVPQAKEQAHAQKTENTSDHKGSYSDSLEKAYKRIAELETRTEELTVRMEYSVSDVEDLAHYQSQPERMMEEFKRMKIAKKKAEHFAIEAKQAAQKLSVENSRLQEQVSRDKHAHELKLKSVLAELDTKSVDTEGPLRQKVMVLEKAMQKETFERKPSETQPYSMMQLLFQRRITRHMKYFFVAFCGLPHSGKSTLLQEMIPAKAEHVHGKLNKRSAHRTIQGMDVYELGFLVQHGEAVSKEWLKVDGEDLHMYMLAYAFVENGIHLPELEQWNPPSDAFKSPLLNRHFQSVFNRVKVLLEDTKHESLANILHRKIAVMNVWDIGISRALYDVLPHLSMIFGRRLLINVLNIERDQGINNLSKQPHVHRLDNEKNRDIDIMRLHSRLHYYLRMVGCAQRADHPSAVLVGTHVDSDSVDSKSMKKLEACILSKAADMGVKSFIHPDFLMISVKDEEHCVTVRNTLETMADDLKLEYDMPLSWIFLRTALYHYPSPDSSSFLITRVELKKLASEVGIGTENELEEFLQIFAHTGSMIYHNSVDSLRESIILNPECFLQTLSRLYTISSTEDPVVTQHREDALRKGIVCTNLINMLWENKEEREFLVQLANDVAMAVRLKSDDHRQKCNYQIRCPSCQDENCYFMPTLRDTLSSDHIKLDSDSMFVTFSSEYVPTDIQAMFVKYLPTVLPMKIELQLTDTYNQTILLLPQVGREIKITVHGKALEINLKSLSNSHELNMKIKGALKTVCVRVIEEILQYHPDTHYQLGVVCPGSDFSPESELEGLHYIHFLPCCVHEVAMFCMHPQCRKMRELGQLQLEWIHSDYSGPTTFLGMPEAEYINPSELDKVVQLIPVVKYPQICTALGVTVEVNQSDLMHSINKWQRLSSSNRKERLARLLFDMGCYEAAVKLETGFLMLSPNPVKLSDLEIEMISHHMCHWKELANKLGLAPERVMEIRTQNKLDSVCCRKLLKELQPDRDALCDCLIELEYFDLAQYLESGCTVV